MGSADLLEILGLAGEVRDPKPNALIPKLGGRGYTEAFGKTCPPPPIREDQPNPAEAFSQSGCNPCTGQLRSVMSTVACAVEARTAS